MRTSALSTDAVYALQRGDTARPVNVLDTSTYYYQGHGVYRTNGYVPTPRNRYSSTARGTTGILCQDENGQTLLVSPARLSGTWDEWQAEQDLIRQRDENRRARVALANQTTASQVDQLRTLLLKHPEIPPFHIQNAPKQHVPNSILQKLLDSLPILPVS